MREQGKKTSTEDLVVLSGNTYPVREALQAMGGVRTKEGGRWVWRVPKGRLKEAQQLVQGSATSGSRPAPRRQRPFVPCGYPGCSPAYCDECDGKGMYGR